MKANPLKAKYKEFPEIGYTPENLRYLIKQTGLSQVKFAENYGIPLSTLRKYLNEQAQSPTHRDMPWIRWKELLNKVLSDV